MTTHNRAEARELAHQALGINDHGSYDSTAAVRYFDPSNPEQLALTALEDSQDIEWVPLTGEEDALSYWDLPWISPY
ncbi:hypothetical protein SAVIM338S_02273 [Streptomyces avidinii]